MKQVDKLRSELLTLAKLGSALGLLGWDQEVNLPPKGLAIRGEVSAFLAAETHSRFIKPEFVSLVKELNQPSIFQKLSADEKIIVRETWRDLDKAQKLPVEFVEKFAKVTTDAFAAWNEARQKSDFDIFCPHLEKVVKMSRQETEYLGYKQSPYDALLDGFEPDMTSKKLDELFIPLSKNLTELVAQVKNSPLPLPKFKYPIEAQKKLNEEVSRAIGYDFDAGRIDTSPHPFTIGFHPTDVRVTTRYTEDNFWVSLGSVIHEVGHALYEQGLPTKEFSTPLGSAVSLGVHESQSRIWENFVGRSREFVDYLYPLMRQHFGKLPYTPDQLYLWLNRVQPSLIRVESDEVTYNMHIIVRYELEKALIENQLKVADLPKAWNQKMKDYLGVRVPSDAKGVLQDIHWSHGTLGYFPTYSLGNLYAAQLFNKIQKDIPGLEQEFAKGNFGPFLKWLRQNIHHHGRRYHSEELIKRITNQNLEAKYLLDHLGQKVELSQ